MKQGLIYIEKNIFSNHRVRLKKIFIFVTINILIELKFLCIDSMKTITYLSFGASFSQALAYVGRKGQNEPMLKQIWEYREESTISFCGPIPKFSELELTYECFYTYYGVENYRGCLEYEELHERELCYFNESSFDLMRGFRAGRNENLKLVDSDLPDFENLDLNDPNFSAEETCGGDYDRAAEILLGECVDTGFEGA